MSAVPQLRPPDGRRRCRCSLSEPQSWSHVLNSISKLMTLSSMVCRSMSIPRIAIPAGKSGENARRHIFSHKNEHSSAFCTALYPTSSSNAFKQEMFQKPLSHKSQHCTVTTCPLRRALLEAEGLYKKSEKLQNRNATVIGNFVERYTTPRKEDECYFAMQTQLNC